MPRSHSIRSTSAPRIGAVRESPYIMHQIPDVFVGFHFSKSGHTTQADAVAHDPEELAVRIRLHVGGTQVDCPRVHPSPRIRWFSPRITMALGTVGTEELVSFGEARFHVRGRGRNLSPTGSSNEEPLALGCKERLHSAWFGNGAQIELKS